MSPAATTPIRVASCAGCGHGFDRDGWDGRHCLDHPDADHLDVVPGDYHAWCCPLCEPDRDTAVADRFDVTVLARLVGAATAAHLATMTGVSVRTVWRWRARGLTPLQADRAAVACGLHPGVVWPTWWQVPCVA